MVSLLSLDTARRAAPMFRHTLCSKCDKRMKVSQRLCNETSHAVQNVGHANSTNNTSTIRTATATTGMLAASRSQGPRRSDGSGREGQPEPSIENPFTFLQLQSTVGQRREPRGSECARRASSE